MMGREEIEPLTLRSIVKCVNNHFTFKVTSSHGEPKLRGAQVMKSTTPKLGGAHCPSKKHLKLWESKLDRTQVIECLSNGHYKLEVAQARVG